MRKDTGTRRRYKIESDSSKKPGDQCQRAKSTIEPSRANLPRRHTSSQQNLLPSTTPINNKQLLIAIDHQPPSATTLAMSESPIHNPPAGEIAVAVKPALKKQHSAKKKAVGHLKWDEAKIQEHDQLRGTRQKIDEPNTPYHHNYDSGSETDGSHNAKQEKSTAIDFTHLSNKLEAAVAAKETVVTDDDDDEDKKAQELKALEFKEHRKRHYNEMELVRKFRAQHPGGLSDEDEDDENDADDEG